MAELDCVSSVHRNKQDVFDPFMLLPALRASSKLSLKVLSDEFGTITWCCIRLSRGIEGYVLAVT